MIVYCTLYVQLHSGLKCMWTMHDTAKGKCQVVSMSLTKIVLFIEKVVFSRPYSFACLHNYVPFLRCLCRYRAQGQKNPLWSLLWWTAWELGLSRRGKNIKSLAIFHFPCVISRMYSCLIMMANSSRQHVHTMHSLMKKNKTLGLHFIL